MFRCKICPHRRVPAISIAAVALLTAFSSIKVLPSTASLSTLWTLTLGSYIFWRLVDESTAGPILEKAAYGCGFYYANGGHDYSCDTAANPVGCYSQVVWSADRNNPIEYSSMLELKSDGNLVLKNADGTIVWSTDTSGKSVMVMKLTESGNLLLFDKYNAVVWQSFSHPTDILVLGQKLLPVFSSTNFTFLEYFRLSSDGHLKTYEWRDKQWQETADLLTVEIGNRRYPLVRGEYGICSNGQCTCPASRNPSGTLYFKQLDDVR
ncbi:hypothetical protein CDL15_Pgr002912 [Punica granatum]|uniref:Bulb-type lectin domain-containing protein n=1 Tax=Punica granatum TaxID=22663 RepID=A0A218X2N8_PUNGR|nr:hypothetical protein CDL15_Pgr002912 [Punica granatum]PKI44026.1 hypothetical protein CRG98_035611 [Punica granatum]